ncbi:MAG: hypothetical protein ACFHWX_09435 [Bacteroidota bacterium]
MGSPPAIKIWRRIIIWTILFIILASASIGILKLGVEYSSEILYQLVKKETNGYYQLSFEEIDIDPLRMAIKLKKVILKPDPNKEPNKEGLNNLYHLELAGLNIDLKSIISIYTRRQLLMKNVRIIDPEIYIVKKKNAPGESFSLQTGDLYKEISNYLRVLQIDLLAIDDAKFKHSPSQFSLGNIDLSMKNLLINSDSRPDQEFYSDNIELEINNQSFRLSDSIHQVSFDRFILSTSDSVLTFENIIIKPVKDLSEIADLLEDKTVYDIAVPELTLKGVDYFSAYRYNHLEMEELSLTDSHIFLEDQKMGKDDQSDKRGNSLLKEILTVFDVINIGKMRLINTNLNLKTNNDYNNNYQHVQSERADIVLYNFVLDSTNYQFNLGKKYFDDVDISIRSYSSFLPDSIHTIHFDLLKMSSFDSSLVFEDFNISNNGNGKASDMYISLDIPLIRLSGLNYLDILIRKELMINEMRLQKPNIIFESRSGKLEQQDLSPDSIYAIISDQFKTVGIKQLLLDTGFFSINKLITVGQADLMITDFNMPNEINSWHQVLGGVKMELYDVDIHNDKLNMGTHHLSWDRKSNQLILDELQMDYADDKLSASGELSNVTVARLNLDSLSEGNYLAFDSMRLVNPKLIVEILASDEEDSKMEVSGNKFVEVINGQLAINSYDSTAFNLDKIYTRFTFGGLKHIHYGTAEYLSLTLPEIYKKLNISRVNLSKSQELYLEDVTWHNTSNNPHPKMDLQGVFPALTIFGWDQDQFWEDNHIIGDSLIMAAPDIQLNHNRLASDSDLNRSSLKVDFQKVVLDKARLVVSDKQPTPLDLLRTPELFVILKGFHYPHGSMVSAKQLLYTDEVTLKVSDLQSRMRNGDSFEIRQLAYDTQGDLILADEISYSQESGATTASLPFIKIVGLDLHAYVNQERFRVDSLQLIGPNISHNRSLLGRAMESNPPKSIDIGWFSATDTEFEFTDSLNTSYAMHRGKVLIHKYATSGEIKWNKLFNDAQYVSISGEDLKIPLGDGYRIQVDRYDLSHPLNAMTLNTINLTSAYTPDEYSKQLTKQKDWFNVSADRISFRDLDLERYLDKQEFYTEKVSVDGLNALFYRDKNVPFDSTAIKPLPQTMLLDLDTWVYIDTLQVKGDITHQLRPEKSDDLAEISFNDINASLMQITTVENMAVNPMQLVATGQLVDAAPFNISVMFDMHDPKDRFSFVGQIDNMQLDALNKLLRPIANVYIRDGYAERINFTIKANDEVATGEMFFRYNNLKVQILNPDAENEKNENQGFKTFFANTFVISDKNPSFIVLKPGTIFQERDPSRVIFHYWGEALLSGAVSSIGINKSKKEEKRYEKER